MAQIPLGDFGQARVVPRADPRRLDTSAVDQAGRGAAAIGQGLADVGQTAANIAIRQRAEEKRQADALARAKAANASSAYQLQVHAAVADVSDQLRRGGDYTNAGALYDDAMSKVQPPVIDGLSAEAQEAYGGAIANSRQSGRLQVDSAVVQARRDDGQRQFAVALDLSGKTAGVPGANVEAVNEQLRRSEEFFITGFGLDRSVTSKMIQDRIDANWTNQVAQRYNDGNNDITSLQGLLHDVTADDGYYARRLDGDKRAALAARIGARIDSLRDRAEHAADRADAAAERTLNAIDTQIASGYPATVEQWSGWADTMRGASPERQQQFRQRIEEEKAAQAFLMLPIEQQMAGLQQRQAQLYTEGADGHAQVNFNRFKTAVEANIKMLTETPLQFAHARYGVEIPPINIAMATDPAQSGTITALLRQRSAMVDDLRRRYGSQVQNQLLLPQEASLITSTLGGMPPAEQVKVFGALRMVAPSEDAYAAIMQQVQKDAPVLAFSGLLYARNPRAATLLAEGAAILNHTQGDGKPRPMTMPPQADFDAAVSSAIGTAFRGRPDAYAAAMQAVRAGYAGAAAADGDMSGVVDIDRITSIVKDVLGETVNFNGRGDVFVPYGTNADDFEDKIEATWRALVPTLPAGVPTDIGAYGLQQKNDGRYYVTSGRMFVEDSAGNPIILDLTKPIPRVAPKPGQPMRITTGAFGAF